AFLRCHLIYYSTRGRGRRLCLCASVFRALAAEYNRRNLQGSQEKLHESAHEKRFSISVGRPDGCDVLRHAGAECSACLPSGPGDSSRDRAIGCIQVEGSWDRSKDDGLHAAGYEQSSSRFPLLYLLQGAGSDETSWTPLLF